MNIIFGEALGQVPDNYTILELDTFIIPPDGNTVTSYCIVEQIALHDFPVLENYKKVHADLLQAYRDQNWQYCEDAIKGLTGRWNGELDTFYEDLFARVQKYKNSPLNESWTGYIDKTI